MCFCSRCRIQAVTEVDLEVSEDKVTDFIVRRSFVDAVGVGGIVDMFKVDFEYIPVLHFIIIYF